MVKFPMPSMRGILAGVLAPIAAVIMVGTATIPSAQAQEISYIHVHIRTGGDDLRGNNDNAFFEVSFTRDGRVTRVVKQVNRDDRPLRDYTETFVRLSPPEGFTFDELHSFRLYVEGFTGGFDGDNWNVDSITIEVTGEGQRVLLFDEYASPLIRFTGDNHSFERNFHF